MAYIDVLPLATVKQYLRIDDTLTEDDTQLTRMIESALKYIEKHTNIHVVAKDKDYDIPFFRKFTSALDFIHGSYKILSKRGKKILKKIKRIENC